MARNPAFHLESAMDPEAVEPGFLDDNHREVLAGSHPPFLAQRMEAGEQC